VSGAARSSASSRDRMAATPAWREEQVALPPLEVAAIRDRLETANRRGRLPELRWRPGPDRADGSRPLFSFVLPSRPLLGTLEGWADETEPDDDDRLARLRLVARLDDRHARRLFGILVAVSVVGLVVTDVLTPSWRVWWWGPPLTVVSLAWIAWRWPRLARVDGRAAAADMTATIGRVLRER